MADVTRENARKLLIDGGRCYTGTHVRWDRNAHPGFVQASEVQYEVGIDPAPGDTSPTILVRFSEEEMLEITHAWMTQFMQRRAQAKRSALIERTKPNASR